MQAFNLFSLNPEAILKILKKLRFLKLPLNCLDLLLNLQAKFFFINEKQTNKQLYQDWKSLLQRLKKYLFLPPLLFGREWDALGCPIWLCGWKPEVVFYHMMRDLTPEDLDTFQWWPPNMFHWGNGHKTTQDVLVQSHKLSRTCKKMYFKWKTNVLSDESLNTVKTLSTQTKKQFL